MKTRAFFPAFALGLLLAGCSENSGIIAPDSPNLELVDVGKRIAQDDINSWVFGSFVVTLQGGEPTLRILGADGQSEPANFPGIGVFYGGHCIYGTWYNPKGKRTSGSMDRPHPHCVEVSAGGESVRVILEPISSKHQTPGTSGNEHLFLGGDESCTTEDNLKVQFVRAGPSGSGYPNSQTSGCGEVVAWAIDESTIWTTRARIGTLAIDLTQFDTDKGIASSTNLFDTDCGGVTSLNGLTVTGCLSKQIDATYTPPSGLPQVVSGILYWEISARANKTWYNEN